MKKRLLWKVLALVFAVTLAFPILSACTPRDEKLKIYNWGDYLAEGLIEEFVDYYAERTGGEKIKVIEDTCGTNDEIYSKLKSGKEDYDLVAPSEYMLQRLILEGLLQPFDRETDGSYTYITNADDIDPTFRGQTFPGANDVVYNFDDYGVAYMWGTTGIAYNFMEVDYSDVQSWGALYDGKYAGKITMKNDAREVYPTVAAYNKSTDLLTLKNAGDGAAHRNRLMQIINDFSTTSLNAAKDVLRNQQTYSMIADEDKNFLASREASLGLMWSGDAIYGFDLDAEGNDTAALAYYVPDEGSAIWADYFAIPAKAGNKKAAQIFIDFVCENEYAIRNMSEIGYTSAVVSAQEDYKQELEEDDEFWESQFIAGVNRANAKLPAEAKASQAAFVEWYKQMYLDTMFPPEDVIDRCVYLTMLSAADTAALNDMWSNIRA